MDKQLNQDFGYCIAVLDKGFVYAGNCSRDLELLYIKEGVNIMVWGTTEGLHQLVIKGPNKNTKLSSPASIKVPWHSVISLHETDKKLWQK